MFAKGYKVLEAEYFVLVVRPCQRQRRKRQKIPKIDDLLYNKIYVLFPLFNELFSDPKCNQQLFDQKKHLLLELLPKE